MSKVRLHYPSLFFISLICLGLLFLLYAYFVNQTIINVVAREKIEKDIADVSGEIGDTEFDYMTLRNNLTLDVAYAKGFKDTEVTAFVSPGKSLPITYNSGR